MENKKENQTVAFENLKFLSQLVNGNEINQMVSNLKKAKQSLETYYKSIKDKVQVDNTKPQVAVEPSESVVTKSIVQSQPAKPAENNSRESFARREQGANQRNFQPKTPYNKNNQQGNFNNRQPNGTKPPFNKPFNKDGARPNVKPDKPMTRKPSITSVVPDIVIQKNDRNFGNKNKTHKVLDENKNKSSIKTKIKMGIIQTEDFENEERIGRVRVKSAKKQKAVKEQVKTVIDKAVITTENLTVKILSEKIGKPAVEIIKQFMLLGMMLNINSVIDYSTAELVANELGVTLEKKVDKTMEEQVEEMFNTDNEEDLVPRAPIVTVMGHVDHGKTSLLDAIKKTNVIAGEAGGITQHIGSYTVNVGKDKKITFIDTPGHAAFTAMRARGAQVTDIAILVVAADDGIMPQTVEAINHIKDAGSAMIVAINKIDKPEANLDRIKQQLTEHNILPEEWGGDTICVPISAKHNQNIDKLLEMVLLVSDMLELKANPNRNASAYVIESKIDKGRGIVTNVIIKNGTLKLGDYVVAGLSTGRIKAMVDYLGNSVKSAGPSMAVSILGLGAAPDAGDMLYVVDEKMARNLVEERTSKIKVQKTKDTNGVDLEDFLSHNIDEQLKVLKLIVKADVMGSVEAVTQTLETIKNEEVKVEVIHKGVGGINESDVLLAQASNAMIVGFNIKPDAKAKKLAETNKVKIQMCKVIYEAVDYITELITGMKAPKYEEKISGHAEVRHLFKISSVGTIAGSYVLDGTVNRNNKVRVLRGKDVLFTGDIDSLKIMKEDVKQVKSGFECGIKVKGFNDLHEGDIIEAFENVKIN